MSLFQRRNGVCCVPGEAHASAGTVGIPEDARGDDLAEGLQHALQLLFVHGQRQVGDVQVGGVLLLLLKARLRRLRVFRIVEISV